MSTIVGARKDRDGNSRSFFDKNTEEDLVLLLPVYLNDDFNPASLVLPVAGTPQPGYPWVKKVVLTAGVPAVGGVANAAGGVIALSLDATSEKQDAVLYANDQLTWDMTKNLVYEARAALGVVPAVAGVESVFGLQSAWIDGPDNAAFYARFQVNGSGAVNLQMKDGVNTYSFATGVTLTAGAYHVFRIDVDDATNVLFSIDGTRVNPPAKLAFAATGASAVLQPYASVYKATGVGTATLLVDMIQVAANRV